MEKHASQGETARMVVDPQAVRRAIEYTLSLTERMLEIGRGMAREGGEGRGGE